MENLQFTDNLISFGLTRQEAVIYTTLLSHGDMTGYEVSKETGISRSNAYAALSNLVDKGASYLIEGDSTKYHPVDVDTFTKNILNELQEKAVFIHEHAPEKQVETDGYITIIGARNIQNKLLQMIKETRIRLYISASARIVDAYEEELNELIGKGKKVVLMTDSSYNLDGAIVYHTDPEPGQLRVIIDSSYVMTGELTGSDDDNCLYSGQKNLVTVMKEALKNKIVLLSNEE
ncbi:MAG: TrmB family transcriptional regulator [Treponema sp.]|nr:TrmB family transcriptional regulator [Treponema sp.]